MAMIFLSDEDQAGRPAVQSLRAAGRRSVKVFNSSARFLSRAPAPANTPHQKPRRRAWA